MEVVGVASAIVGEGGRWMVRGKKGMVDVPVGTRSSLGSLVIWIEAEAVLEGVDGDGGGPSRRMGLR